MIKSYRGRNLKRFRERGQVGRVDARFVERIEILLDALDAAEAPEMLDLPGFGFHSLRGNLAGRYALTVSRNFRMTFAWDGMDAIDVDLENYH